MMEAEMNRTTRMKDRRVELEEELAFTEREIACQQQRVEHARIEMFRAERELERLKYERRAIEKRLEKTDA